MELKVMIQVLIKEQTEFGEYNDGIYFTPEEFEKIGLDEVAVIGKERVENYIAVRKTADVPVEYSKEELQAQLEDVQQAKLEQIEQYNAKIEELKDAIIVAPKDEITPIEPIKGGK